MKCKFFVINVKKLFLISAILIALIIHFSFYFTNSQYSFIVKNFAYNLSNSFSSEKKLYEQSDNNLYFVSKLNGKLPELSLPINSKYNVVDGTINFEKDDHLIVKSAGYGKVKKIGKLDNGLKFIEIEHGGVVTRYENLKIVGVGTNFLIFPKTVIGTLDNEPLVFKILCNDKIITNFEIKESEIKWVD